MLNPSNTAVPKYYEEWRVKVEAGEIPVCNEIRKEMDRIEFLIQSPDYYFDNDAVEGWVSFCESELTLPDGSDLSLLYTFKLWGEQALGWYKKVRYQEWVPFKTRPGGRIVERIEFKRLIKRQYLIIPRGAAKTMYCETLHAHHLIVEPKTTHQLVCAPTEKLADETLSPLRTAIEVAKGPLFKYMTKGSKFASNDRRRRVKLESTAKGIRNTLTNSKIEFRPMSIAKLQGWRGNLATVDEWLSQTIREDPIGTLMQGAGKNEEFLLIATSSEGQVRNGPGDNVKMYLEDILDGKVFDPTVSIWYYKMDSIEEIADKSLWQKANPTIGVAPLWDAVEEDVKYMEAYPSARNDILAKRFDIATVGLSYWFDYEETIPHTPTNYDGMMCSVGGDFSRGDDFCTVLFMFPGTRCFGIDSISFVTSSAVAKLDRTLYEKYQEFISEGSLIVMDDPILDMDKVADLAIEYCDKHQYYPVSMGFDAYNADVFCRRWKQAYPYCAQSKVIQGAITETVPLGDLKNMAHDRSLVFHQLIVQFTMGNACVEEDTNGNRKLYKKNREAKIDCVAAMVDALVAYNRNREVFRQ